MKLNFKSIQQIVMIKTLPFANITPAFLINKNYTSCCGHLSVKLIISICTYDKEDKRNKQVPKHKTHVIIQSHDKQEITNKLITYHSYEITNNFRSNTKTSANSTSRRATRSHKRISSKVNI